MDVKKMELKESHALPGNRGRQAQAAPGSVMTGFGVEAVRPSGKAARDEANAGRQIPANRSGSNPDSRRQARPRRRFAGLAPTSNNG